jgi:hypothetical protein
MVDLSGYRIIMNIFYEHQRFAGGQTRASWKWTNDVVKFFLLHAT